MYEGSPTVVTALLATGPEIGVLSILVQVGPVTNMVIICTVLSIVYTYTSHTILYTYTSHTVNLPHVYVRWLNVHITC